MSTLLRNMFIAVIVMTGAAYAVRDMSLGVTMDRWSGASEAEAAANGETDNADYVDEIEVDRRRDGHFVVAAEVNGSPVEFVVDTGATMVVLSAEAADRLGFDAAGLDFTSVARTANGPAPFARIVLDEITIGNLTVNDVEAAVMARPISVSLLGMSFLSRLQGYEVRDGRLVLRR